MNIIRLLRSDEYIKMKLERIQQQNQKVKIIDNVYNKISILRYYEKLFGLKPLEVNYKMDKDIILSDKEWALIKKLFRNSREKPTNMTGFKISYIQMIKNITDNEMINITRERSGSGKRAQNYELNINYIQEQIELNKYQNPKALQFDDHILQLFNIEPVRIETIERDEKLSDLDKTIDVFED